MNKRYFIAMTYVRTIAQDCKRRVKSFEMIDETGLLYRINYFGGDFQDFRIGSESNDIVLLKDVNDPI